jgi:hypothetical protein
VSYAQEQGKASASCRIACLNGCRHKLSKVRIILASKRIFSIQKHLPGKVQTVANSSSKMTEMLSVVQKLHQITVAAKGMRSKTIVVSREKALCVAILIPSSADNFGFLGRAFDSCLWHPSC